MLESKLLGWCDLLAASKGVAPFSPEQSHMSTLKQIRRYLEWVIALPGFGNRLWEPLFNLNTVKNCIAHSGGRVDQFRSREQLQSISQGTSGLTIRAAEQPGRTIIEIDYTYCKVIVEDVARLFGALFASAG